VLLILKVNVDRTFGYAGTLCDLIERRLGIAISGKLDEGGFDDLLRPLGFAPAASFRPGIQ